MPQLSFAFVRSRLALFSVRACEYLSFCSVFLWALIVDPGLSLCSDLRPFGCRSQVGIAAVSPLVFASVLQVTTSGLSPCWARLLWRHLRSAVGLHCLVSPFGRMVSSLGLGLRRYHHSPFGRTCTLSTPGFTLCLSVLVSDRIAVANFFDHQQPLRHPPLREEFMPSGYYPAASPMVSELLLGLPYSLV
jgi:hypothetical protein